ncbi:MAG: hypothetical protein R3323_03235 [Wenzhouxiangellaceae bacterium]|nr:hypothetical protein [Wenzhouxiangellaceae bacterium]
MRSILSSLFAATLFAAAPPSVMAQAAPEASSLPLERLVVPEDRLAAFVRARRALRDAGAQIRPSEAGAIVADAGLAPEEYDRIAMAAQNDPGLAIRAARLERALFANRPRIQSR